MKKITAILILIPLLFQTGCWDAREINEIGFVLSVGLDKSKQGFRVTAEIANPETFSKTTSGSNTSKNKPFWIISSNGKTIFEAIRNMSSRTSRRIFWAHIKVIIISERLAKNNALEIFDFFTRNPELRLRTLIAFTPDKPEKIINVIPETEKDPAIYLESIILNKSLAGKSYSIMLKDFLEDYLDQSVCPVTSRLIYVKSKAHPFVRTSGAYVFYGNKSTTSLNEEETRGFLWIKDKMKDSIMVVNCPVDNKLVTLEIKSSKSSYKSSISKDIPKFLVNLNVNASVTEQSCNTDFNGTKNLSKLSKSLEKAIHKDVQSTIEKAKNLHADFPGLSHVLHRQHNEDWHKIASNWSKVFGHAKVTIAVNVHINHISLARPLKPMRR